MDTYWNILTIHGFINVKFRVMNLCNSFLVAKRRCTEFNHHVILYTLNVAEVPSFASSFIPQCVNHYSYFKQIVPSTSADCTEYLSRLSVRSRMLSLHITADQCTVACSYVWFPIIYNSFTKDVAGEESQQSGFSC